ncbi:unnamed protein product [Anisakis simplex]|uniref:Uncharacterized protein n=1 Tax=Anisakis simplex TaxID=6269 RepID=A0A3P6S1L9_ANISI|nr:unnamed protein product [Anisakis simplex]
MPVNKLAVIGACSITGEVVQLEQRLCDLKTKCIPSNQQQLSKQLSTASENFMRTLRPQFSIRNENGFWLDDEIGVQSGFDVRDLILTANDEEIATISEQVLSIIEPYLSIAELEVGMTGHYELSYAAFGQKYVQIVLKERLSILILKIKHFD